MKRKSPKQSIGRRLVDSLREAVHAIESPGTLSKQLTVREVEIIDPGVYNPARIRKLRKTIGASQGVFAFLLGVSTELVQHWEQGVAKPRPMARRLLDEISRDPAAFASRIMRRERAST